MRGKFITFEGGDGVGKSTQLSRLAGFLHKNNIPFVETREPGGTQQSEDLRNLVVRGDVNRWQPISELLIMTAARAEHVHHVIEPALNAGKWVLCDRFIDSTAVYQGVAGGVGFTPVFDLHTMVNANLMPDTTFLLDMPEEVGLSRASRRGGDARFEKKGETFHKKIREGFLELASTYPERIVKIDAQQDFDHVWHAIQAEMINRFDLSA